jgi:hypothetical protein
VQHRKGAATPQTPATDALPVQPASKGPVARGSEGMIAGGLAAPLTLTQSVEAAGSSQKRGTIRWYIMAPPNVMPTAIEQPIQSQNIPIGIL